MQVYKYSESQIVSLISVLCGYFILNHVSALAKSVTLDRSYQPKTAQKQDKCIAKYLFLVSSAPPSHEFQPRRMSLVFILAAIFLGPYFVIWCFLKPKKQRQGILKNSRNILDTDCICCRLLADFSQTSRRLIANNINDFLHSYAKQIVNILRHLNAVSQGQLEFIWTEGYSG